jgi:hypothetical protein
MRRDGRPSRNRRRKPAQDRIRSFRFP